MSIHFLQTHTWPHLFGCGCCEPAGCQKTHQEVELLTQFRSIFVCHSWWEVGTYVRIVHLRFPCLVAVSSPRHPLATWMCCYPRALCSRGGSGTNAGGGPHIEKGASGDVPQKKTKMIVVKKCSAGQWGKGGSLLGNLCSFHLDSLTPSDPET
jgi:hypothetical protein